MIGPETSTPPRRRPGRAAGRLTFLLATLLTLAGATTAAAQTTSWLDAPPRSFNTAGAAVPAAPPSTTPANDPCRARERPAAGPEETQVAAAGWKLEQYWPTQRAGDIAIVMGNASYDGMCRDAAFNGFAFVGGRFAGTISPNAMFSRTDGVLAAVPTIGADRRVTASFIRYAATDPLCCPSRGQSRVTYRIDTPAAGPVLVPDQIVAVPPTPTPTAAATTPPAATPPAATPTPTPRASAPSQLPRATTPTQLPRTGLPPLDALAVPAIALLALGRLIRRPRA